MKLKYIHFSLKSYCFHTDLVWGYCMCGDTCYLKWRRGSSQLVLCQCAPSPHFWCCQGVFCVPSPTSPGRLDLLGCTRGPLTLQLLAQPGVGGNLEAWEWVGLWGVAASRQGPLHTASPWALRPSFLWSPIWGQPQAFSHNLPTLLQMIPLLKSPPLLKFLQLCGTSVSYWDPVWFLCSCCNKFHTPGGTHWLTYGSVVHTGLKAKCRQGYITFWRL